MDGHGCPQLRVLLRAAALALAWLGCSCAVSAADPEIRLRISWGGGPVHSWQGKITVDQGQILEHRPLGFEADTAGAMQRSGSRELIIFPRVPRSFDGWDITLAAPREAKLSFELAHEQLEQPIRYEVTLAQALQAVQRHELDKEGTRLVVARPPGDTLRLKLPREGLVFAPGERLTFEVQPVGLELANGSIFTLQATVSHARSDTEVSTSYREFRGEGDAGPTVPVSLDLPIAEGVYDIRLSVAPKRLGQSLTQFVRFPALAERRLQVVVIDPNRPQLSAGAAWQTEVEIDPASPKWWERIMLVPSIKLLPGFTGEPLGSVKPTSRTHLGRTLLELPAQAWQAYPLPVSRPGEPHIIELEYPSDLKQTLSLTLIEPDALGKVTGDNIDSGFDVPEPGPGHKPAVVKHRLICWPQSRSPLLLVVNRRSDGPAVFGRIRLLSGASELEPLKPSVTEDSRQLVAMYSYPLFARQFSGAEAPGPARTLEDWGTFYHGGRRLVEYLKHVGYTSAVLPAASNGSALYPSVLLEPSSEQDGGLLLESGQDAARKDVLELMFLLFDRAGLKLMPSLSFSTPLPALERLRLLAPEESVGIEPIGADGRTALVRYGARAGHAAYYNPLDPRVQQAIRNVVQELAERYKHHPSFAGVVLSTDPDSYLWLPDDASSCDDATIARFTQETGLAVPGEGAGRFAVRARFLRNEGAPEWLKWRAEKLSAFFAVLQREASARKPQAEMSLALGGLTHHRHLLGALRPSLTGQNSSTLSLLQIGMDAPALASHGILLLRPQQVAPLQAGGTSLFSHLNQSAELDRLWGLSRAGEIRYEALPLSLPAFDRVSPFGRERTRLHIEPQHPASQAEFRREIIHAIARYDCRTLHLGGEGLPLGQEEALKPIAEVFRRLPQEAFATVDVSESRERTQPVVLRTLKKGGKLLFYAVNDAPWPVQLELDFQNAASARIEGYGPNRKPVVQRTAGGLSWQMQLEPYELVGGEVAASEASIAGWRVSMDSGVESALREKVREARLRANALRMPHPVNVLSNGSLELPGEHNSVPGWVHAEGQGITVAVAEGGYRSPQALHVASKRGADGRTPIVWLRSEPFDAPATGRLSIVAWLRVSDLQKQPKLRMALEGKWQGKPYYRRANIGASEDGRPVKALTSQWAPYRFPVNDLPLSDLTDLRVGFDMMDEGEFWLDDVQVFDLWFEDQERDELLKNIATADVQLDAGRYGDCQRFLNGYWPWYLKQFVPLDGAAIAVQPAGSRSGSLDGAAKPAPNTQLLDRMKGAFPSLPKWPLR